MLRFSELGCPVLGCPNCLPLAYRKRRVAGAGVAVLVGLAISITSWLRRVSANTRLRCRFVLCRRSCAHSKHSHVGYGPSHEGAVGAGGRAGYETVRGQGTLSTLLPRSKANAQYAWTGPCAAMTSG